MDNTSLKFRPKRTGRFVGVLSSIRHMATSTTRDPATSTKLAAPRRVRIDFGDPPWLNPAPLRIVHLGQSALVLSPTDTHQLVIISSSSSGLMPCGICIPDEADFARVHANIAAARNQGLSLDLADWSIRGPQLIDHVDLGIIQRKTDPAAIRRIQNELASLDRCGTQPSSSAMNARPIRALARPLALAALSAGTPADAPPAAHLRALVGAGPGTTPTGDDIIVGVLAGLRMGGYEWAFARVASALPALLDRTTIASRHYLNSAIEGRFGEHVQELVRAASAEAPIIETVTRAARWGATSGIDLLTGLLATTTTGLTIRTTDPITTAQRWPTSRERSA